MRKIIEQALINLGPNTTDYTTVANCHRNLTPNIVVLQRAWHENEIVEQGNEDHKGMRMNVDITRAHQWNPRSPLISTKGTTMKCRDHKGTTMKCNDHKDTIMKSPPMFRDLQPCSNLSTLFHAQLCTIKTNGRMIYVMFLFIYFISKINFTLCCHSAIGVWSLIAFISAFQHSSFQVFSSLCSPFHPKNHIVTSLK